MCVAYIFATVTAKFADVIAVHLRHQKMLCFTR